MDLEHREMDEDDDMPCLSDFVSEGWLEQLAENGTFSILFI